MKIALIDYGAGNLFSVEPAFKFTKANYYLFIKERKHYLLVAVRYLNGDGYVTTAFITPHVRKR